MRSRLMVISAIVVASTGAAWADELIYRYEGDVLPYDESAGWVIFDECGPPCSEYLEDGHFIQYWPTPGNSTNYSYVIAQPPDLPPPTLWVEWSFRSNHPIGTNSYLCDSHFTVHYEGTHEYLQMYGDAAISGDGGSAVLGLSLDEFHTFRYECLDGVNYWISVDGVVFFEALDEGGDEAHYIQFGSRGGCGSDYVPDAVDEWDMIRYGAIDYGETVVSTNPPAGNLSPVIYPDLDRFTVTFDSPNYVYTDEISVKVTGGTAPVVLATRRQDNGPPETVEIVLDHPMPIGETTSFTIDDGTTVNVIEYTLITRVPAVSSSNMLLAALLLTAMGAILLTIRTKRRPVWQVGK